VARSLVADTGFVVAKGSGVTVIVGGDGGSATEVEEEGDT